MQTDLKSDSFCSYNQQSGKFFWVFEDHQYNNNFVYGEVGVPAAGGSAGSYIPPNVIDISSFLSGRDDILSKCNPPIPALESLNQPILYQQNEQSAQVLLPEYTKEKRSTNELSAIDYNRWNPLLTVPQDLDHVIENFSTERGGLNTTNFVKSTWSNQNNVPNFDSNLCKTMLDPNYACGQSCEEVNGYPGRNPITGKKGSAIYQPLGKPPGQPNYPFTDVTSQQAQSVGAIGCGSQFFSGPGLVNGSCPPAYITMLNYDTNQIPLFSVLDRK